MSGDDVHVIEQRFVTADAMGFADCKATDLPISTVAAVLQTTTGPGVSIFHQFASQCGKVCSFYIAPLQFWVGC